MNEIRSVESVLRQKREIENSLLSRGLSWKEEYTDACSKDLENSSREVIDNLEKRYNGRYNLKDIFRYRPSSEYETPLARVTLLDRNDYGSKIEPNEYEVDFKEIKWSDIKTPSSERTFTFHNNGYITFEKDITLDDYYNKYHFYGNYNPASRDFKIAISRNYVDRGFEKIETAVFHKFDAFLHITYNGVGISVTIDDHRMDTLTGGDDYDMSEIEERVEKAEAMIKDVKKDLLIPGLENLVDYCLNKLEVEKEINGVKDSRTR